jgi:anhydro-N-acetylmuramic acid kinase
MTSQLYIGLMSGTSIDAVDCALVEILNDELRLIDFSCGEITPPLKRQLLELTQQPQLSWHNLGDSDIALAKIFASTVIESLRKNGLKKEEITGIGSHGQTLWHQPLPTALGNRFTWQLGDPNTIAYQTGITTVADFRRHDMAAGGQGAPLVPAFHYARFQSPLFPRVVLNLGGIANITVMKPREQPFGYDTGPANLLMDAWIYQHQQLEFDRDGAWGLSGTVQPDLLHNLRSDPYFALTHPKSTGRELFNLRWLQQSANTNLATYKPADVQATLLELTASTVAAAIGKHATTGEILVCGGGANNTALIARLQDLLPQHAIKTTHEVGLPAEAIEAVAFAWFAYQTLRGQPIDFTPFTGANRPVIAGGIYRV